MSDINQRMKNILDDGLRYYNGPDWEKNKWKQIDSLAMAHMFFHDIEKAQVLFLQRAEQICHNMGPKNDERELRFLDINGSRVRLAILYDLACENVKAKQEFDWATTIYKDPFICSNEDHIAAYFLWYGYSKLVLDQIEEAYDAFLHTVAYFKVYPRNGGELDYVHTQYFLPLLLLPLCEYLLEKNDEKRSLAIYGRDEFVRIMDSYNEYLYDYYIYYQHLAYRFPDAYDPNLPIKNYDSTTLRKNARAQRLMRKKVEVRDTWGGEKSDPEEDIVQIINDERDTIEFIGTFDEILAYDGKLDQLGDFPATLSLFDFYTLEIPVAPDQIVAECDQILSSHDLDGRFFEMTEIIRDSAVQAANEGRKLLLWHTNY